MDPALAPLGWSAFQQDQLDPAERSLTAVRVSSVHRSRLDLLTTTEPLSLTVGATGDFAVGDWLLLQDGQFVRRLDRSSELARDAAGGVAGRQLIAANVDTLFIVTSCNADFNLSRLERYLALAAEAGCEAVLLLTKADLADDPDGYLRQASGLARGLPVLAINALDPDAGAALRRWTGPGRTVALMGSSGVGKTTLMNGLTGRQDATEGIRAADAKGRHTTTNRLMVPVLDGGWLIDTPGMRELRLPDVASGIAAVFADIEDLAATCKFNDCAHGPEPGCAVQAALSAGTLDPRRLANWMKLRGEDRHRTETQVEARAQSRKFGKMMKKAIAQKGRKDR